jgi:uncharacterized protein YjiS (DUF1127 family)
MRHHADISRIEPAPPLWRQAVKTISLWAMRRNQRLDLGELDDHHLDDIGRSRDDVRRECAKPFWKG